MMKEEYNLRVRNAIHSLGKMERRAVVLTTNAERDVVVVAWHYNILIDDETIVYKLAEFEELCANISLDQDDAVDFVFDNKADAEKLYDALGNMADNN